MILPEYKELALPDSESEKRETVDSHHLAEVIIREMIGESSFCGILIARKRGDFFYLANPVKYRVFVENQKVSSNEAREFRYSTLSGLWIRADKQGKQEHTDRVLAINKFKRSSK